MKTLAIIAACAAWMCVDCAAEASPATDAIKACAPFREMIRDAAEVAAVPAALLTALSFKESSCNPNAVNGISGAIGIVQLLPGGAGDGYSREQLKDPVVSLTVGARYLAKWHRRCGTWRGAVSIYNGSGKCSARTEFSAKVIRLWKSVARREDPKV